MKLDANRPVVVVTGASAGVGKATARQLVQLGWQTIGVGRDPTRSAAARAEISGVAAHGGSFIMLRGDFTLMAEVTRLADEIKSLTPRLDVLINNAGGVRDRKIVTAEGTEATFAANHLAPFLLTRELMPLLRSSAADLPPGTTRVLTVSSTAHRSTDGSTGRSAEPRRCPSHPRLLPGQAGQHPLYPEVARRAGRGVVAQAMHPGVVASNFASHGDEAMQAYMAAADKVPPDEPAETLVWLATDPEGGRNGGRYFYRKAEELPSEAAQDDAAAVRLWTETEGLLVTLGF